MNLIETIQEASSLDLDHDTLRALLETAFCVEEACDAYFDGDVDSEFWSELLEEHRLDDYVSGDDEKTALLAVCREFGYHPSDCTISNGGAYGYGYTVQNGREEYSVMTDDDADSAWDDALESYLDDGCVEGADSRYFNREAWKSDAKMDGRGHCLSGYDGNEYEVRINEDTLVIHRTN